MEKDKILNDCNELIFDEIEYENYEIMYVLNNKQEKEETIAYAINNNNPDEMIMIKPYTKDRNSISKVVDWDYNFDNYLFENLEKNFKIEYMNENTHYGVWNTIKELYPEDIQFKKGVQKYLKYCKSNKISKKFIDDKTKLNTPNIMLYLESKSKEAR